MQIERMFFTVLVTQDSDISARECCSQAAILSVAV